MSEVFCNVYKETDYSKFKYLIGNRNLTETRKKKIMDSIQKVGYVLNPIIVNEKMEIIDGQGRHAACKELGLPIYYVIAEGASTDECVNLNIGQTNWAIADYINFYTSLGNENYKKLSSLIDTYKELTVPVIVAVAIDTTASNGRIAPMIKNGSFTFATSYAETQGILEFLYNERHTIDLINGSKRTVVTGLAWVIRHCAVDRTRLFKQIVKRYTKISPVTDVNVEYFLGQIEVIYNNGLRAENCVDFVHIWKTFQRKAISANGKRNIANLRRQTLAEGA